MSIKAGISMSYIKRVKDLSALLRLVQTGASGYKVSTVHNDDKETLQKAKALHAKTYLRVGFLDEGDIEADYISLNSDPHQLHARYFVITDKQGEVVATCRQIYYEETRRTRSFPIFDNVQLWPEYEDILRYASHAQVVEISGLSKVKGTPSFLPLLLYRHMWQYSIKNDHEMWLMALDTRLFDRLKRFFGSGMVQVADIANYKGGDVVPSILSPQPAFRELLETSSRGDFIYKMVKKRIAKFFLEGDKELIDRFETEDRQ